DNNVFEHNYLDRAGAWAPVTRYRTIPNGERAVRGVTLRDNLFLYGSAGTMLVGATVGCFDNGGGGSSQVPCGADEFMVDADPARATLSRPPRPAGQSVTAAALGDFDGDGTADPVLALATSGIGLVVGAKNEPRHLGEVLLVQPGARVIVAAGDFEGVGHAQ